MSSPSTPSADETTVEWVADLTLEYGGRTAAALVSRDGHCVLEIESLAAFKTLGPAFAGWKAPAKSDWLNRLAGILPTAVEIRLRGVSIGTYHPRAAMNWEARTVGLPFGSLTIHKLALIRASLRRD